MGIKIIKAKPKENVVPNKSMHKNYNNLMIMTMLLNSYWVFLSFIIAKLI